MASDGATLKSATLEDYRLRDKEQLALGKQITQARRQVLDLAKKARDEAQAHSMPA